MGNSKPRSGIRRPSFDAAATSMVSTPGDRALRTVRGREQPSVETHVFDERVGILDKTRAVHPHKSIGNSNWLSPKARPGHTGESCCVGSRGWWVLS